MKKLFKTLLELKFQVFEFETELDLFQWVVSKLQ